MSPMSQTMIAVRGTSPARGVSSEVRLTRGLLGAGVVAGPVFLAAALAQVLTRDGFDLGQHAVSLLALGPGGFVQTANFLGTGLLLVLAGTGVRRAWGAAPGAVWGPRLVAGFGLGMLLAGLFCADPSYGFPIGTPAGPGQVSWHRALHGLGFVVAMLSWSAACVVLARGFAARGQRRWAAGCLTALLAAAVTGAAPLAVGERMLLASAVQLLAVGAVSARLARIAGR